MSTARGPNVSVLHVRSTSSPWDATGKATYSTSKSYRLVGGAASSLPPSTKQRSLGGGAYKWWNSPSFRNTADVDATIDRYSIAGEEDRELSPVRWHDGEVDGVYLNKSGWVQVEHRSLEEKTSKKSRGKLADYRFDSEPVCERPTALVFHSCNRNSASPSPPPDSPSVTPIISPPPAFQDRVDRGPMKRSKTFFGKTPFLPRSNAIEDSDASPPATPQWRPTGASPPSPLWNPGGKPLPSPQWKTTKSTPNSLWNSREKSPPSPRWKSMDNAPPSPLWNARKSPPSPLWQRPREQSPPSPLWQQHRKSPPSPLWNVSGKSPPSTQWKVSPRQPSKPKTITDKPAKVVTKMPQTKSLEDTTVRRNQFLQHYKGSSSSSSSSMGFRSLDSSFNRPGNVMPRLSENTDSSMDHHQDADEEDNDSSSVNVRVAPPRDRDRISPSGRSNRHHRTQTRRSPAGSDGNKTAGGSSSSSDEFPARSPPPPPAAQTINRRGGSSRTVHQQSRAPQEDATSRVRRSRSLQLPERKPQTFGKDSSPVSTRVSPQHLEHRTIVKIGDSGERAKKSLQNVQSAHSLPQSLDVNDVSDEVLREAEVVTGFLYGNRTRVAAQALLNQRYNGSISKDDKNRLASKAVNSEVTVYYVGNVKKEGQKVLVRGATSPVLSNGKPSFDGRSNRETCSIENCSFWPHCSHREGSNAIRPSHSYPTHQRSLDSTRSIITGDRKAQQEQHKRRMASEMERRKQQQINDMQIQLGERRTSPVKPKREATDGRKTSPVNPKGRAPTAFRNGVGSSFGRGDEEGAGTRESVATRPGSAPSEDADAETQQQLQQRSMSLPKSFLSASYQPPGGTLPWQRHGTESVGSSPGPPRKLPTPEPSLTAPVTPLHEGNRHRSPVGGTESRRAKASSTPQLLEESSNSEVNKWESIDQLEDRSGDKDNRPPAARRQLSAGRESGGVMQKFRKTFSLHFHHPRKLKGESSKEDDEPVASPPPPPPPTDRSVEESLPFHVPSTATCRIDGASPPPPPPADVDEGGDDAKEQQAITAAAAAAVGEHKYRFGSLVWRNSKEKKKLTKAARSAKCNSGDSGIQIEIVPNGGSTGCSSESHDTDPPGDVEDSPPRARRRRKPAARAAHLRRAFRPYSEVLNQILIDKFKADLKQRAHPDRRQVRRTRSDLSGRRTSRCRRPADMLSSPDSPPADAPAPGLAQHPADRPPDVVVRRRGVGRRATLRRSLSQPLDIDKLSPLMKAKRGGLKFHNVSDDDQDHHRGTSDEETMSDSESSVTSLIERKKSLELPVDEDMIIMAEAVFDHVAIESEELGFRAGDVIEVLETAHRDWWWGSSKGKFGWFPAHFVRLRVSQEDTVEDCLAAMASGERVPSQLRRRASISLLSNDQVRTSVVRELVQTERDFVKALEDIVDGYMAECRKRADMFADEQIEAIFVNLEEILSFQSGFLKDLEDCMEWEALYKSCVGGCFLKHRSGFKKYSDYCNNHPVATATLQELYQFENYNKFFEACRLMRGLIEIPLDGYLLCPIQRICKYPLQLAELLKYTKADHADYDDIKEALEAMRGVAMLINERKRKMESLEKLSAWQQRVEGWEDEDLIEVSSQLIHQGEVVKATTGMWTNNITLFLFDHQIVYCKKDILKRSTYVYKGRFCLDTSEVIDVPDGKDAQLGVTVRHAIKLHSTVRDKWLLFCCRSTSDKQRWLRMFDEERKLIEQDKSEGLDLAPSTRHLARMAARSKRRPPRKPRNGKNFKHDSGYVGSTTQLNATSTNSLGRKVGTWFTFSNRKARHQQSDVS
ncbi:unnamed protein product [Phyllotreta striolata]|uniref:Spermatogenesis-associated protein 13 n=1 Tax=Phyllotreta striolata TaxID=444603 RepID=A0A9N9TPC2_PHYSR|nr:unnamed protein product [Phyllotreta striolata]